MTKKNRLALFIVLLVFFMAAAPLLVGYSWGYRLDLEAKKITQTGGFYFKVWPKNSQVYLDGKPAKKTDFFFGAVYIDNLIPKKYEVEIRREGYHSWKKRLQILEKQVTDAKNVVLMPQNPGFTVLARNVEEFFPSPDQRQIVLKETENNSFTLKLLELDKNIKSHISNEADLKELSAAEFVDSFFLTATSSEEQSPKDLYYFDREQQSVYWLNPLSDLFEKILEEAKGVELSPDKKKVAYFSSSEIWVLFLENEIGQPSRSSGEKLLIGRFAEKIGNVFWMDNNYLAFSSGEKIKVAEIDDREGLNIVDLAQFTDPKIFFNKTDKKLYVASKGDFYVSVKLMP